MNPIDMVEPPPFLRRSPAGGYGAAAAGALVERAIDARFEVRRIFP